MLNRQYNIIMLISTSIKTNNKFAFGLQIHKSNITHHNHEIDIEGGVLQGAHNIYDR